MLYKEAIKIAKNVVKQLAPHCEKIEIAGSLRRKCREVKDIEIVAIPKPYDVGLFQSGIATVVERWKKIKGELPCKYTQRMLPEGIKLDLFFATPENWGFILAIRTGSADFSHLTLGHRWVELGYKAKDGHLYKDGQIVPVPTERDFFRLLRLNWVEPEMRI
jgi:DNA polymerase/3'-5' exonuclease PolX